MEQYKKHVCQCTDGLSPTQNDLGAAVCFSTLQELILSRQTHYDSPYPLSHWFVSITRKIWYATRCILPPATDFFCIQDFRSLIVQVEYQGQTRNTRILERKPLIKTSYCIQHRLELKYFHFTQFLLNAAQLLIKQLSCSSTSKQREQRTWNLGQILEIKLWMVGQ